jgi:hypothetical protein
MANRIDAGVQPTAHTAVQAMIVRAQQAADQTGKAVGVRYDLASDEISLIEITPETPKEISFVRIASPAEPMVAEHAAATGTDNAVDQAPDVKAAAAA